MNKLRVDIATELASLAHTLAGPMPANAAADGWRPETWQKWAVMFFELQSKVQASETIAPASISRALDHDGVTTGPILERAAAVSNALRALGQHA